MKEYKNIVADTLSRLESEAEYLSLETMEYNHDCPILKTILSFLWISPESMTFSNKMNSFKHFDL